MGVLNFTNGIFKIKLSPDEDYTEFKFLTGFEVTPQDDTSAIPTSTRTVQVGNSSSGAEIKLDQIELPDNSEHARLQHRIVTQGKNGFSDAIFEGYSNTDNFNSDGSSVVKQVWLMRHGTFLAADTWNPTDMLARSATIKVSELNKEVDGYDGSGDYNTAKNG
jgi:hypothetical protein